MRNRLYIALLLCAGQQLAAQEISVYGSRTTPGPWADGKTHAGFAVAGARPIRAGSRMQAGVRVAFSELRDTIFTGWWCVECGYQTPQTYRVRMRTTQLHVLLLPYATRNTRVDLGFGLANYRFDGDLENSSTGTVATIGVSRRLLARLPLWATAGYEKHLAMRDLWQIWPQDAITAATPESILRLGVSLRR